MDYSEDMQQVEATAAKHRRLQEIYFTTLTAWRNMSEEQRTALDAEIAQLCTDLNSPEARHTQNHPQDERR